MEFSEKFNNIEHGTGKVVLEHVLFDQQECYCEELHIINDDSRIGLILKNQEIYINKQEIKSAEIHHLGQCDIFTVSDDRLTITVFVNKL